MAIVSYLVWYGLDDLLGRHLVPQLISLGTALAAGGAAYMAAVVAVRLPEAEQLKRLVGRVLPGR